VPNRREFLHHTLWSALALWAGPSVLLAANGDAYTVQKGDTLSGIAARHGTSVSALKRSNNLRSDVIRPGQKLTVPAAGGTTLHVVERGDTLSGIAAQYGSSVAAIKGANNLRSDTIRVGQELRVPARTFTPSNLLAPVIAATERIRVDASRWRYIVCHHSAIEAGNAAIYGKAHEHRGMEHGLAYHFVIGNGRDSGDGEIEIGPRWQRQLRGGHVRSTTVNDSGIGICLVGNLENHAPTRRQRQAMNELLDYLRQGYVRRNVEVTVHKWVDKNHTVCPGRRFPYGDLKRFA